MLKRLRIDIENFDPINFDYGINIILGNKLQEKESYNSLGKTLLLRLIDYLLGSKESYFYFEELKNKSVIGYFEFKIGNIEISRKLTEPNSPISIISSTIDELKVGDTINIKKWTSWLGNYYWSDNRSISFRSFSHIFSKFDSIYKFEESIKSDRNDSLQETGKKISYLLRFKAYDKISENCTFTPKEKNVLTKISEILDKSLADVPKLELESIETLINKCDNLSKEIRDANLKYEKNKRHIRILRKNLDEIDSLLPQQFSANFNIYKNELGDFLRKNYQECYEFHRKVLNENREQIQSKIDSIIIENKNLKKEIDKFEQDRSKLLPDLSQNIEQNFSNENAERYILNRFISKKNISSVVKIAEVKVKNKNYEKVNLLLKEDTEMMSNYKEILTKLVKFVCKTQIKEIEFIYSKNNVFKTLFSIQQDKGEGYGSIRSLIFLFLLLCINAKFRNLDYFLLDSAAIDSVDKDVLARFFRIANIFCKIFEIQFISGLNIQNINEQKLKNFYICKELTPERNLFNCDLTPMILDNESI